MSFKIISIFASKSKIKKMKKVFITLALVATIFMSSCMGSFNLTKKYYSFNKSLGDKWLNEVLFFASCIIPVYNVCLWVDAVVLNSIEFWTGEKVIGQVGTTKDVMGKDGRMYAVKTLKNGYEITDPDGEKSYFVFNKKNKSWSYSKDGDIRELFSFNEDGSIQACLPSGAKMNVTADENGLFQLRMAMNDGFYYAFNK